MVDGNITDESPEELGVGVAKNGAIYLSSTVLAAAITLSLLIFLTHILPPEVYGLYIIAVAFTSVLGMAGNFGIGTTLRKKLPESKTKKRTSEVVSTGYFAAMTASAIAAVIGICISRYLAVSVYGNIGLTIPLMIASVTVFLSVIFNMSNAVLVGIDRIKQAAVGNITYSLAQLTFVVALVLLGYSITGALAGLALGLLAGFIVTFRYVLKYATKNFVRPTKEMLHEFVRFSIPIALSNIAMVGIANFAIDLLGVFAAVIVVGSFGASFKLGRIFEVVLASTTYILLPAFTKVVGSKSLSKKVSSIYDNSIFYMLLLMLPLLVLLISAATPITRLLFSEAYPLAAFYFSIISIGIASQILGSFAGTLIISYGDPRKFMKYQLTVVFTELALLLILTPILKAYGILISLFIIGPVLLDTLYLNSLSKQFSVKLKPGRLVRLLLASIAMWAILTVTNMYVHLGYVNILVNAALIILVYPPLAVYFGSVKKRNTEFLRKISVRMHKVGIILNAMVNYTDMFQRNPTKK